VVKDMKEKKCKGLLEDIVNYYMELDYIKSKDDYDTILEGGLNDNQLFNKLSSKMLKNYKTRTSLFSSVLVLLFLSVQIMDAETKTKTYNFLNEII